MSYGALDANDLGVMRDVVTGVVRLPGGGPLVFKSVGMAWEELVVAESVLSGIPGPATDP